MDFLPSEEQRAIRKMVQDFARHQVTPYACGWEEREEFPRETFRALAALGLSGMLCPREYGGLGLDHLTAAMVYEELGKAYQGLCFLAIHNMVGSILGRYGNEAQKRRWLPPLIRGDLLAAFACTEPSAGSDIAAMESTAVPQGNFYLLSGNKVFITSAGEAEVYLVAARTGGTISLFVIEKGTPGLRFGKAERKMGLRSIPHCQVFFQDCPVPREDRLGEEGQGLSMVLEALDSSRVEVGAFAVGLGEAALEEAVSYARVRTQFGKPIASFQGIAFMLADMAIQVEGARLLVYQAASLLDAGQRATEEASMAKVFATDAAMKITTDAVQVLGAYGYTQEYKVERYMREAKAWQISEGTNQIQRVIIARQLLKWAKHDGEKLEWG